MKHNDSVMVLCSSTGPHGKATGTCICRACTSYEAIEADRRAPVAGDQPSEAAKGNSCQPASPSKHRIGITVSPIFTNHPTNHIIVLPIQ